MSNTSHENCTHASTKAGRAQCRRARAKFADAFSAVLSETLAGTAVETPEPAFESIRLTADTWRDHKETPVKISTMIDLDTESVIVERAKITSWGKRWINYTPEGGTLTRRCAADTTSRVFTLPAE